MIAYLGSRLQIVSMAQREKNPQISQMTQIFRTFFNLCNL